MRRAAAIGLLMLGACSLEPRYVSPLPAVPSGWPVGDAYLRQTEATLPAVTYRDIFREPRLQSLIDRALANNQNVAVALANVDAARAQYRIQRSSIFPTIGADTGVSLSKINTAQQGAAFNGGGTRTVYNANVGLSSFEIDLFGRLRSLSKAALQDYLGTESAVRATRLSLVGELASAYLTLAADRSLLAVAVDTEASALRGVELTRARLRGGIAPRSDLRQAETVLAQARSDRANLITAVAQDRNAIDLLVGSPVADADLPASIESVDGLLGELPAGLDSRVLLRRPDVVQAEYQLRGENARIGAARAAFFPSISLTGAIGFASTALSSLFSSDTFTWSASPGAGLTLFDAGARSGNLALARARRDAALGQYQLTVQTAFREVADALARRGTIDRQLAAQNELEAAARDNFLLAEARYREGIEPFLTTLDAQRTLYAARRSLTATRLTRADNLVTLYRVLGGDMLTDALPVAPAPAAKPR